MWLDLVLVFREFGTRLYVLCERSQSWKFGWCDLVLEKKDYVCFNPGKKILVICPYANDGDNPGDYVFAYVPFEIHECSTVCKNLNGC